MDLLEFTSEMPCLRCSELLHWSDANPPKVAYNTRTGKVWDVTLTLFALSMAIVRSAPLRLTVIQCERRRQILRVKHENVTGGLPAQPREAIRQLLKGHDSSIAAFECVNDPLPDNSAGIYRYGV